MYIKLAVIFASITATASCASSVEPTPSGLLSGGGGSGGAGGAPAVLPPPTDLPCPDGAPCGHPGLPQWGTCLGGFCCTSCVADGACAIPNTLTPGVCGEHGEACAPDGAACDNGWTCGAGNCGVCSAEHTKCGRLDGIAGWCADVGGSLACLRYDAPALSSPGCSAGCTDAAAAGATCQGADGSAGCAPGCCPLKYDVVLP